MKCIFEITTKEMYFFLLKEVKCPFMHNSETDRHNNYRIDAHFLEDYSAKFTEIHLKKYVSPK